MQFSMIDEYDVIELNNQVMLLQLNWYEVDLHVID